MPQENVEIVRNAFMEFERGNFWLPELFDPNVRIGGMRHAAGESEVVGLDSMAAAMKDWFESWEQTTLAAEQVMGAGDQVVVIATWRGRGKASGVMTEQRHGQVWTLRDGKVTRAVAYIDPAEALEAAGLRV